MAARRTCRRRHIPIFPMAPRVGLRISSMSVISLMREGPVGVRVPGEADGHRWPLGLAVWWP